MATLFPRLTSAQFASPSKPTVLLIRAVKPSPTAGTLCAIVPKLVGKYKAKQEWKNLYLSNKFVHLGNFTIDKINLLNI
jgi:hypothetical protein